MVIMFLLIILLIGIIILINRFEDVFPNCPYIYGDIFKIVLCIIGLFGTGFLFTISMSLIFK
jgi:hypothetical protein